MRPVAAIIGVALALGMVSCGRTEPCALRRPVLFVHGSGLDSKTWSPMRKAFESSGYPRSWLLALDLRPADGSSIAAGEQVIKPAVEALLNTAQAEARATGCSVPTKVDVVAHSMGSMAARWYVAQVDATRVQNLVGIAPANHGSNKLCGLDGDGNRELCPAFASVGTLLSQLNGSATEPRDETPYGAGVDRNGAPSIAADALRRLQYTTFRLAEDEWLDPAGSPVLDGAGGLNLQGLGEMGSVTSPGNILWHGKVRHDDLPRDPRLISLVVASLRRDVGP